MAVNLSLWIWVGLAVLAAWSVGAYSRLLRLRQSAEQARSSLRKYLLRCREIAALVDEGVEEPVSPILRQVSAMAELWGREIKGAGVPTGLADAIDLIAHRLIQIRQQPEDLAGAPLPQELLVAWDSLAADIIARRTRYNVHVMELNEALLQMPASLLARVLGMQTWECL